MYQVSLCKSKTKLNLFNMIYNEKENIDNLSATHVDSNASMSVKSIIGIQIYSV